MNLKELKTNGEAGYVTVLFMVATIIIVGVVSYNIYVAYNVNHTIHLQNKADISTFTLSSYSARGLNFISANNVAIASSLHIATSVPILATYLSAVKAALEGSGVAYQRDIWDRLKPVPANYLGIAAGLSKVNKKIEKHWMDLAWFKAVSILKENSSKEEKIAYLFKQDNDDKEDKDEEESESSSYKYMEGFFDRVIKKNKFYQLQNIVEENMAEYNMDFVANKIKGQGLKYKGLYRSSAKESICFILEGSREDIAGGRDNTFFWLSGFIPDDKLHKVVSSLSKIEKFLKKFLPGYIGYYKCGIDFKAGEEISLGNGFDYEREFGYYEEEFDRLGVTVIDNMEEFKRGIRYRGKFWKETRYGIMGKDKNTGDKKVDEGKIKKIVVEVRGEVNNRMKGKDVGMFYPEWYPVLKDGME